MFIIKFVQYQLLSNFLKKTVLKVIGLFSTDIINKKWDPVYLPYFPWWSNIALYECSFEDFSNHKLNPLFP